LQRHKAISLINWSVKMSNFENSCQYTASEWSFVFEWMSIQSFTSIRAAHLMDQKYMYIRILLAHNLFPRMSYVSSHSWCCLHSCSFKNLLFLSPSSIHLVCIRIMCGRLLYMCVLGFRFLLARYSSYLKLFRFFGVQ